MNQTFFITGIGTDVGKTVVSAILTEALQADYWKPIQAGDLDNSDIHTLLQKLMAFLFLQKISNGQRPKIISLSKVLVDCSFL